ncbi:tRNA1(Val) (adenine(37)-N6)-methyltransferase [Ruoffia tabacinasalis]|mgnify:CR=1 FL=1|uniref:tRNA1(Val) (Adenine(37)-N6)-methyltransferase n=1 Tax=Ruoffia tabacinasalis TaxID=87458 RepID=A0ABS0LIG1_9LACT|nr:tRNA1(Val) (adenine(37)-N6)-methyltransferase [Ruoffia tabacinasalis]MBG9977201.1 tRNA1(Val) (adenine(37)-N6)-methyltransferase [Ruoffia tabacinasalis]HJG48302.1 tRNA1(Val) (adenine(37)-N6)-methyltransferase [Ruoffia tabacinasalis]
MDVQNKSQLVHSTERVDSFLGGKLGIIQSTEYFTLSVDALLLANFIKLPKGNKFKYLDFCSGNGVIPLLLSHRTEAPLNGIELQEPLVDMARRSAKWNGKEDQITFVQGDINDLKHTQGQLYDIISCNPPYFLAESSNATHRLTSHALARHELMLTMEQWVKKASQIMREKGKLFIVHRPSRLDDLIETLLNHHFSIHRIQFIHPKKDMNANGVLIEAIYRGGRRGVKIEPAIVVHEDNNEYTPTLMAMYNGE